MRRRARRRGRMAAMMAEKRKASEECVHSIANERVAAGPAVSPCVREPRSLVVRRVCDDFVTWIKSMARRQSVAKRILHRDGGTRK